MVLVRGAVVSLLFAMGWLALVFNSRPHVAAVPANRAAIQTAIETVDTWSFTPAMLKHEEWGSFESAGELAVFNAHPVEWLNKTSARLDQIDHTIGQRLILSAVLTLAGVSFFWFGIRLFLRAKEVVSEKPWARGIAAGGPFVLVGPLLPCLVAERPAGLLISGPPLVAGFVIVLMTLGLRRLQPPS